MTQTLILFAMKHLFFLAIILFQVNFSTAQTAAKAEQSDPEAKKILDKIRKK